MGIFHLKPLTFESGGRNQIGTSQLNFIPLLLDPERRAGLRSIYADRWL